MNYIKMLRICASASSGATLSTNGKRGEEKQQGNMPELMNFDGSAESNLVAMFTNHVIIITCRKKKCL